MYLLLFVMPICSRNMFDFEQLYLTSHLLAHSWHGNNTMQINMAFVISVPMWNKGHSDGYKDYAGDLLYTTCE